MLNLSVDCGIIDVFALYFIKPPKEKVWWWWAWGHGAKEVVPHALASFWVAVHPGMCLHRHRNDVVLRALTFQMQFSFSWLSKPTSVDSSEDFVWNQCWTV